MSEFVIGTTCHVFGHSFRALHQANVTAATTLEIHQPFTSMVCERCGFVRFVMAVRKDDACGGTGVQSKCGGAS